MSAAIVEGTARMPEEVFIRHCSPTMAGIKTANLFTCRFENVEEMRKSVRELNSVLVKKGIRVLPLRYRDNCALIYAYRPSMLSKDLQHHDAFVLLQRSGYTGRTPECCLVQLVQKLSSSDEFPHEIGLFLGYPPKDVCGFIENKAKGYKCTGEWKVYTDADMAQKLFAKYRKCTKVYCAKYAEGRSMERLTVAVS